MLIFYFDLISIILLQFSLERRKMQTRILVILFKHAKYDLLTAPEIKVSGNDFVTYINACVTLCVKILAALITSRFQIDL